MCKGAIERVPTSTIFFKIGSDLHLQLWIECYDLANRHASQAQYCFPQVCWRAHDGTAFVNQSLHALIKVKATFATRAADQMLLHDFDFIETEFPVNI